jgi:hypothetical protein
MSRALTLLFVAAAFLAAPAAALAQSAGDEQYTDPFGGEEPAGQQQEPAPAPEQPVEPPSSPAEPAPGGNGTAEAAPAPAPEAAPTAEATQEGSATLPRTGGPVVLVAAIGYALLLAGIAIRRKA